MAEEGAGSAVTGALARENAVENNALSGDNARQPVKECAEWWKKQARDKLGEGTTSAIANSIINAIADSGDTAIGSADYIADAAMALASCATGDGYCDRALIDLSDKNQAVADSVKALMSSDTCSAVADTIKQASEGNQAALEATGGMLAGIILPGKKVPHVPNSGAVGDMGEFFKQSGFGNLAKESSQKSSQVFQGQSVYQAKNAIGEHISRGDKYYLDGLHKDHIEVFDSRGKVKAVLNLDGSYNQKKRNLQLNKAEVAKMINIDSLDEFSREYLVFLKKQEGNELRDENLYLADDYSLVDSIQRDVKNINLSVELFIKAKNSNDELAMRAALLHIRSFMMGVSGAFYQAVEDIDIYFKIPNEKPFPEDYKVPEHYNYPIK
ncbi:hypothetical protein [Erwinia sp. 198]|uniref:hypothetical protein n=1 Tax=Erwinia sp. 198 TaxID=2022746 RepID=UPI001F3DDAE5|nr:hypothetical protein [Erwinia sp. 198]